MEIHELEDLLGSGDWLELELDIRWRNYTFILLGEVNGNSFRYNFEHLSWDEVLITIVRVIKEIKSDTSTSQ